MVKQTANNAPSDDPSAETEEQAGGAVETASAQEQRDQYLDKLDRIAEILKVWRPDLPEDTSHKKIVHDVRNLVNEVVLLRELTNLEEDE